jgi:flagellum-specific peptidoglycan hydrolase FlgJ
VAVARKYATDPNYATILAKIAGQANVAQAIGAAQQETSHTA